ncbi:MAG TPA: HDOD domain-containing protein [Planctomycetaceae bacterium]|jgi:HD-like signal output (HDOD) protein|nr:HDOD domain-containing protein [Planctomycetaceae bacterium]
MIDWKHLRAQVMGKGEKPPLPPRLEVPKMPHTVSAICERAQKPDCTAADLCEVLEQDPSITVDLLKHVNSAATGLRTKAATVRQAVALLGVKNTRLFVTTTVLEQHMRNTKSPLILGHLFCLSAMERALLAREIAKATNRDTDLAFAGALIQDFILPSFTKMHVTEYAGFMKQLSVGDAELTDLESAKFGCTHADCAAYLMLNWGFPDDLICCALLHHRPTQVWALESLRHTALPAIAATSWLPSVLAPSTAHLPKLCQFGADNFKLDVATLAQSVDGQLRGLVPNLASYVTLHQHLANSAVSV